MKITDEQLNNLIHFWNKDSFDRIKGKEFLAALKELKALRAKPVAIVPQMLGSKLEKRATAYWERTGGRAQSFYEGWRECESWMRDQITPITPSQLDKIEKALVQGDQGIQDAYEMLGNRTSCAKALEIIRGIKG